MRESVCAVVVTFNRLTMLKKTLHHLDMQTREIDRIVIVNNASTDDTKQFLQAPEIRSKYEVYNLENNIGGAGGFAYGMQKALDGKAEWIWIMDDDAFAAPDCLHKLLSSSQLSKILIPVQINERGEYYGVFDWNMGFKTKSIDRSLPSQPAPLFTFVGPLFNREVIERVGLPNKDYFICCDDIDYSMRVKSLGYDPVSIHDAVIYHSYGQGTHAVKRFGLTSMRPSFPAWKNYYNTRNEFFLAVHLQPRDATMYKLHLFKSWARGSMGELAFDSNGRAKFKFRLMGIRDALMGRTGKRVSP